MLILKKSVDTCKGVLGPIRGGNIPFRRYSPAPMTCRSLLAFPTLPSRTGPSWHLAGGDYIGYTRRQPRPRGAALRSPVRGAGAGNRDPLARRPLLTRVRDDRRAARARRDTAPDTRDRAGSGTALCLRGQGAGRSQHCVSRMWGNAHSPLRLQGCRKPGWAGSTLPRLWHSNGRSGESDVARKLRSLLCPNSR